MNSPREIIKQILTIILVLIVLLILSFLGSRYILKNKVPHVFGYSILKVVSGSMYPEIEVGNYIVIKQYKEYKVNDIVTFIDTEGNVVTHRIIKMENDMFTTKGDANNIDDGEFHISCIQGKVIWQFRNFYTPRKYLFLILLGLFLLGGLVTMIIPKRKK